MENNMHFKDYLTYYEACNWDPKLLKIVLRENGIDKLTVVADGTSIVNNNITSLGPIYEFLGGLDISSTIAWGMSPSSSDYVAIYTKTLKSLGDMRYMWAGTLALEGLEFKTLGRLESINSLSVRECTIGSLGRLNKVSEFFNLYDVRGLESLGKLKEVMNVLIHYTNIKSLGNLTTVHGNLRIHGTPLHDFGSLKMVKRNLRIDKKSLPDESWTKRDIEKMISVGGVIDIQ